MQAERRALTIGMERISIRLGQGFWSIFLYFGRKACGMRKRSITIHGSTYSFLAPNDFKLASETVVLLHGFTGCKDHWLNVIRHLKGRINFIAIDLPGHGGSDFDRNLTFEQQALALVEGVLSQYGVKQAGFIGASVGAWVACSFALENIARVSTLTLIGPAGVPASGLSDFYRDVDEGKNPFWISTKQEYAYLLGLALKSPPPDFWPLSDFLLADYLKRQPTYRHIWEQISDSQKRVRAIDLERLSDLPCPRFVVWGDEERTFHCSTLEMLQSQVNGIRVHRCRNSGHAVQCDQPKWLANLVAMEIVGSSS